MKKIIMALVCLMTIVLNVSACKKDTISFYPNITYGENFSSVMGKIDKAYILHGYYGHMENNLTSEEFFGNTCVEVYEFMGYGFFKYNGFDTKKGWLILTFKNKKLMNIKILNK